MAYIKNLRYTFDNFTLNIPSLEIKENEVTVLMGPSGAGKTTLFNLMTGFISYKGWQFEINGVDFSKKDIADRNLGVVFQSFELFPHMTAKENVELVMRARNNQNDTGSLEKFKSILKLEKCWNTKAQVLSGGEKQRVSLLRAIMAKPQMLLLDEPFSALDENNKEEARKLVKNILAETKITTLMISHDSKDSHYFGSNLVLIEGGQVRQVLS